MSMSEYDDLWERPDMKRWAARVVKDMWPKVRDSDSVISLVPPPGKADVKFMVETGAAVCLDKPILLVVTEGTPIPRKLRIVADEIVRISSFNQTGEAADAIQEGLLKLRDRGLIS